MNINSITNNTFKSSPKEIVSSIEKTNLLSKNSIKELHKTNYLNLKNKITKCCIDDLYEKPFEELENKYPILEKFVDKNQLPFEIEQLIYKIKKTCESNIAKFAIQISKKDTHPDVLEKKQQLIDEFGVKELYLDNNIDFAQNCYATLSLLKKNNLTIPERIIGTNLLNTSFYFYADDMSTIVVESNFVCNNNFSTQLPYHAILHECMHGVQKQNIGFSFKKIPPRMRATVDKISLYAKKNNNNANEIYAELMCKKVTCGLNTQEEELLNYLEK